MYLLYAGKMCRNDIPQLGTTGLGAFIGPPKAPRERPTRPIDRTAVAFRAPRSISQSVKYIVKGSVKVYHTRTI